MTLESNKPRIKTSKPQTEYRQLFLPGMEEFIAKLDRPSKPNRKQSA